MSEQLKKPFAVNQQRGLVEKKLVVFDFDGVIADSWREHRNAYIDNFAIFGRNFPLKTKRQWKEKYDSRWEQNYLKAGFKKSQLQAVVREYWKHLDFKGLKFFPGIQGMVKTLARDYDLALLSTTHKEFLLYGLRKAGLKKFFKKIVGLTRKSNKAQALGKIMNSFDAKPSETVMIGDTESDIKAGKANRTKTIGVTYGWYAPARVRKTKPSAIARKPSEIPKLVEKLFN